MEQAFYKEKITIGFHPEGYKIDKTAEALDGISAKVEAGFGHCKIKKLRAAGK